jgi:hypothetical protein
MMEPIRSSDLANGRHGAGAIVQSLLAPVLSAFDAVAADPHALLDAQIRLELAEAERLTSRVRAWQARLVDEANRRELAQRDGCASPAAWLTNELGISRAEAARRQEEAAVVGASPAVGEALARGEITPEHARTIGSISTVEPGLPVADLVDDARLTDAGRFAIHARRRRRAHQADGGLSEYEAQRANRRCSVWVRPEDGMVVLHAELDPAAGARPRAVLMAEAERLWRAEHPEHSGPVPAEIRTNQQRLADAFCNIFGRPPTPGLAPETAEVLVGVTLEQLRGADDESASVLGVGPIPAATARRLACEARIVPVVLGGASEILDLGRSKRLASRAQRRALRHLHRGCGIDGCDVPWEWCQVHHITPWEAGGRTDLDSMVPLCSAHHHLVHEGGCSLERRQNGSFRLPVPDRRGPSHDAPRPGALAVSVVASGSARAQMSCPLQAGGTALLIDEHRRHHSTAG